MSGTDIIRSPFDRLRANGKDYFGNNDIKVLA